MQSCINWGGRGVKGGGQVGEGQRIMVGISSDIMKHSLFGFMEHTVQYDRQVIGDMFTSDLMLMLS